MKKYLKLNDVVPYKKSFLLSNIVWQVVIKWDYFAKDTIGKQFVRSVDSIAANIAEGFGRYTKKDKIKFYRYSYASVKESLNWLEMALKRNLILNDTYNNIHISLKALSKDINSLIKITNSKLQI